MLKKQEKEIINGFLKEKNPQDTIELGLYNTFDYYAGLCYFLNKNIKKQTSFSLLSKKEKSTIENYIKLNKYNNKGIEMQKYYDLLIQVIKILEMYLPLTPNASELEVTDELVISGIKFIIPDEANTFLYRIFKNIDIKESIWEICDVEAYKEDSVNLIEKNFYLKDELDSLTSSDKYYIISLILKVYEKYSNKLILTCSILESKNVEIICNDEKVLEFLYKNAQENNFEDISYIY